MRAYIYQINLDRDNEHFCFMPYDYVMEQCAGQFPSESYDRVYILACDDANPEKIFRILNLDHPSDYTARSLSVSDIVVFEFPDGHTEAYYCNTVGFTKVDFNPQTVDSL